MRFAWRSSAGPIAPAPLPRTWLCRSGGAELVRDALIAAGASPAARIDTSWLGEGKQDVPTPDDVAAQRNRVVDIVVQEPS